MSAKEKWIMAVIVGVIALWLFKWDALYLYGLAALIYLITRAR